MLAIFLLAVMNNAKLLGQFRNRWFANCVGVLAVMVVGGLGLFQQIAVASGAGLTLSAGYQVVISP